MKTGKTTARLPARSDNVFWFRRLFRINRRGASAVEFAVVAPVFLLLVLGMVEYGRMVMVQQVITNATREGARAAALDGATNDSVTDVVVEFGQQASITINPSDVTVTPSDPGNAAFGEPVEVEVSLPFSQVSWLPSPMYLGGKSLVAKTVMRREAAQ